MNIQKQTSYSNWCGQSSTRKIEEEALQKNQADKFCRGGGTAGQYGGLAMLQKELMTS